MRKLLTAREAADFLGVAVQTLYWWSHLGKVPVIKVGRLNRYRVSDLEEWLERRLRKEVNLRN